MIDMGAKADYGHLRSLVLGVAENYLPQVWGWVEDGGDEETFTKACSLAKTVIPERVRDEVIEDLEIFSETLVGQGIRVIRPPREQFDEVIVNENYLAFGNDYYNMRDLQIVLGDNLVFAAPSCPSRVEEMKRLKVFLFQIAEEFRLNVVESPTPLLPHNPVQEFILDGAHLVPLENQLGEALGGDYSMTWHRLIESEVLFDAANIARFNNDLLYLVSSTGNKNAFDWLKSNFHNNYQVSFTDVYRSSHIDSTLMPLSENLVLANAARVNYQNIPTCLREKKVIFFDRVASIPEEEQEFHKQRKLVGNQIQRMGFHSNLLEMSSPWAGLNVLMLADGVVAVESRQEELIDTLEENGLTVVPVRLRHPYTFLGGLHCSTLDLERL